MFVGKPVSKKAQNDIVALVNLNDTINNVPFLLDLHYLQYSPVNLIVNLKQIATQANSTDIGSLLCP